MIYDGFKYGFYINYNGPISFDSQNLKSTFKSRKIESEIIAGRIVGPFDTRPISNLRCSPIGLIPKKDGGIRLITHLSYPPANSVNDFIDVHYTSVKYSSAVNAITMFQSVKHNTSL